MIFEFWASLYTYIWVFHFHCCKRKIGVNWKKNYNAHHWITIEHTWYESRKKTCCGRRSILYSLLLLSSLNIWISLRIVECPMIWILNLRRKDKSRRENKRFVYFAKIKYRFFLCLTVSRFELLFCFGSQFFFLFISCYCHCHCQALHTH